jgi:hypothetical protein
MYAAAIAMALSAIDTFTWKVTLEIEEFIRKNARFKNLFLHVDVSSSIHLCESQKGSF